MNITDIDYIRELVDKKLKEKKMSQSAFAVIAGLHQPTLFRFLKGQTVPTIENMNKIVGALIKIRNDNAADNNAA